MANPKGNPRCEVCYGLGVIRVRQNYLPCRCVRGTKLSRDPYSRAQSPDGTTSASEAVARLRKRFEA